MATLAAPRTIETRAAHAPLPLRRRVTPAESGGYTPQRNLPVLMIIVPLHLAVGVVLFSGKISTVRPAEHGPILIDLAPVAEPIAQPPLALAPVPTEVTAPEVVVETPPAPAPAPVTVTAAVHAAPVAVPSSAKAASLVAAAPMTPPDFTADQLDNPAPRYPTLSRRNHEEGTVELKVLVSPDGRAEAVTVAKSSGFERLDKAALEAVRKWRFRPASQAGRAIAAWVLVPIPFVLSEGRRG